MYRGDRQRKCAALTVNKMCVTLAYNLLPAIASFPLQFPITCYVNTRRWPSHTAHQDLSISFTVKMYVCNFLRVPLCTKTSPVILYVIRALGMNIMRIHTGRHTQTAVCVLHEHVIPASTSKSNTRAPPTARASSAAKPHEF